MKLVYENRLKNNSRLLRGSLTDAEKLLWSYLRRKQILDIQFYRQRPIGKFIVDFYAPAVKLIIEVDGGQHFEEQYKQRDKKRDNYFSSIGLTVLRFDNLQVLNSIDSVTEVIFNYIQKRISPSL